MAYICMVKAQLILTRFDLGFKYIFCVIDPFLKFHVVFELRILPFKEQFSVKRKPISFLV